MGLGEDIKSLFTDDFKEGARQATDKPILFIDPDKFKDPVQELDIGPETIYRVSPRDIQTMRTMLDTQYPNFSADMSNTEINDLVLASLDVGPFAMKVSRDGEDMCIINQPHKSIDSKNELMPLLAHSDKNELGVIPGWDDHWMRIVGMHEGEHCDQPVINSDTLSPDEINVMVLQGEVDSDREAQAWLKKNNLGEIADALKDYRSLAAAYDPKHATGIFLDAEDAPVITLDHYKAAQSLPFVMLNSVAEAPNMSMVKAADLYINDKQGFNQIARQQLESGAVAEMPLVQANPHISEYMQSYLDAYQRQILDPDPVQRPAHTGPQHHHLNRFSQGSYDDNIDYITASISLERVKAGEILDTIEEKELNDILHNPETDEDVLRTLNENYPAEMQAYMPGAAPAQTAPAAQTSSPVIMPVQASP